jgi:hypothetical protein
VEQLDESARRLVWGDLSWVPALALAAAAAVLLLRGLAGRLPAGGEALRLAIRIRRLIFAAVSALLGAGIWLHEPWLVAAGLIIGFEEALETGMVIYALRRGPA